MWALRVVVALLSLYEMRARVGAQREEMVESV